MPEKSFPPSASPTERDICTRSGQRSPLRLHGTNLLLSVKHIMSFRMHLTISIFQTRSRLHLLFFCSVLHLRGFYEGLNFKSRQELHIVVSDGFFVPERI